MTPVFGNGILLTDHVFCAVSGKQRWEELLAMDVPKLLEEEECAALHPHKANGPRAPAPAAATGAAFLLPGNGVGSWV